MSLLKGSCIALHTWPFKGAYIALYSLLNGPRVPSRDEWLFGGMSGAPANLVQVQRAPERPEADGAGGAGACIYRTLGPPKNVE